MSTRRVGLLLTSFPVCDIYVGPILSIRTIYELLSCPFLTILLISAKFINWAYILFKPATRSVNVRVAGDEKVEAEPCTEKCSGSIIAKGTYACKSKKDQQDRTGGTKDHRCMCPCIRKYPCCKAN